jgi:hypothetical protein
MESGLRHSASYLYGSARGPPRPTARPYVSLYPLRDVCHAYDGTNLGPWAGTGTRPYKLHEGTGRTSASYCGAC